MKRSSTILVTLSVAAGLTLGACGSDSKGGTSGDFCTLARAYNADQEKQNEIFNGSADAAAVKAAYSDIVTQIGAMVAAAPPEIKKDAQLIQSGIKTFNEALASVDYDVVKLFSDPSAAEKLALLDTPEFTTASENLDAYLSGTCGIATES